MTDDQKTDFLAKLMIGKKYGGTITHWFPTEGSVYGELLDEANEEYPDGKPIKTSPLVKIHSINDEQILETRNSYYRLLNQSSIDAFYKRKKRPYW